jgi:hypothetical protein
MGTDDGHREFACFPIAILGFVVNDDEIRLLLREVSEETTSWWG